MKSNSFYFFLIMSLSFFSCQQKKAEKNNEETTSVYQVKYAKGFSVKNYTDYRIVTVNDPWDSLKVLQTYVLVDKNKSMPQNLPEGTLVRTPLGSVAVYSTIHCTVLDKFGLLSIVKAVCEPEYINLSYIKDGLKKGNIVDLGLASNPNVEKLIMVDPEAILASPIQGTPYGSIEKTGIPMIEIPDYMENTPLGRAEWIRFYSLFTGKEQLADSLFTEIETEYNRVKNIIASVSHRPSVFTEMKYGNTWYVAGGNSFIGNLLNDAGANYVWKDDKSTGAKPLSFESVLDRAGDAEFWLIKYNQTENMTYKSLEKESKAYSYFDAFKNKNIYACNTGKSTYYEDLSIHPELILQNMAYIFHPSLFPEYKPKYYNKIAD
ncbi:MAG: ABC transporter substrate-binding protein [Dysgonomonas sp.]